MRLVLFISLFILFSCQETIQKSENKKQPVVLKKNSSIHFKNFEERVRHVIMEKLAIPSNEKFSFEINREHLNNDEKKDAIILVNRLEFAVNEAAKTQNPSKRAELGYMGSFNHFIYYDGAKDEFSFPVVVPSSAKAPLKVYFDHIQSENYKDIIIEYRIRNAAFRNYYALNNLELKLVFQWKTYDLIGENPYEANYFTYEEGTFCLVKDIVIYKGIIKNYSTKIEDIYLFNKEIIKTNQLEYRFMFDPNKGKYVTNAKPKNEL